MTDTSPKTAFYMALWNDYKSAQKSGELERSYIYRYLKLRKDEQAGRIGIKERERLKKAARLDVYVYVQSLFMGYEKKQIKEKALIKALRDLIEKKSNLRVFAGEIDSAGKGQGSLEEIRNKLLDKCLKKDVQMFFTDIGYKERMAEGQAPGPGRKNAEMLDLYFGFAGENEWGIDILGTAFSSGTSVDRTQDKYYVEACKRLFDSLLAEDASVNVFVPLFIDEASGSGVFIIGRERMHIPESDAKPQKNKAIKTGILDPNNYHEVVVFSNCAFYIAQFCNFYDVDDRSFELSFEIIDSAGNGDGELEKLIEKYRELKNLGRFYEYYPPTNEELDNVGKTNTLFGNYFIESVQPSEPSGLHETVKTTLVETREDELYFLSKNKMGKEK